MPPIRLDHIAIALPRLADAPSVLVATLGGVPERIRPADVFRWASWTYADGGCIEVLMRILVDVDPTAAEGPLLLEVARAGVISGLEAAGDRLGIRLLQRSG